LSPSERTAFTQGNADRLTKLNGEDVTKKTQVCYSGRKVRTRHVDHSDDIRPDCPPEISIDAILSDKIEMDPHTKAWKLALSLGISRQIMINHLHHDLEMKRYTMAGVSDDGGRG
jgi:hypothetical protein